MRLYCVAWPPLRCLSGMKQKSQFAKECKHFCLCWRLSWELLTHSLIHSPIPLLVRPMMYGFGDDPNPRQDSVELVEELMLEYLTQVVLTVMRRWQQTLFYFFLFCLFCSVLFCCFAVLLFCCCFS